MAALVAGFVVPQATAVIATYALQPVLLVERWFRESESTLPVYVRTRAELEAALAKQADELALQSTQTDVVAALRAENASLTEQLAYATSSGFTARVLQQPPLVPYDRIVLNRGARDGVVEQAPVYAGDYVLIGQVIQVTARQSVAQLLSAPGVESTVYVFGPDIYTTAVGQGGGVIRIGVPQGVPLAVGNPVSVPAAGLGLLGSVTHIETEPTRPEQYGFVSLPEPLQSLQYVHVGTEALAPVDFATAREHVAATRETYFTVPVPEGVLVDIPAPGTTSTSSTATSSEIIATTTATDAL